MSRVLCLASSSKSRKELLEQINMNFFVKYVDIDESEIDETPEEYVKRLSKSKVQSLFSANKNNEDFKPNVIVGADSIAVINNTIIGKPSDKNDAIKIIKTLSGKTHEFLTGLYLLDVTTMNSISETVRTFVTLIHLNDEEIEVYVNTVKPYSWAGGYSSSKTSYLIKNINGSISNIQGLPTHSLKIGIEKLSYQWFDFIM
ncbi:MAG: Maf-like protein YhdE [Candidatus Heimdallarchaeota archaeon LC_2]|nr:MAG: Maf-like protein YhdE [Candidatus Heimdallarchaeota archaeon LC_2]